MSAREQQAHNRNDHCRSQGNPTTAVRGSWVSHRKLTNLTDASPDHRNDIRKLTGYMQITPSVPQNLSVATANQMVILTWPAVTGAANYTVERSQSSDGPYTILDTACTPAENAWIRLK
jgi:hypothetical protein